MIKEEISRLTTRNYANYRNRKRIGEKAKKIEATKKDLEILGILKKKIYIISETKDSGGTVLAETIRFSLNNVDKDYTKIKEWLENDK